MAQHRTVIDTNVFIAGLRSRQGASNRILQLIGSGRFEIAMSVPVALEYEEAAKNQISELVYSADEVDGMLGYICAVANQTPIFFLWRPSSRDPKDEKFIELAVAGQCDTIVTFNRRNFIEAKLFGIQVLTPRQFLRVIGE